MKISFKPVAFAVLSAVGSAAALAAPPPSSITVPATSAPNASDNGNLMLFAWDTANGTSVAYDLGLTISQISIPDMTVPGTTITFNGISLASLGVTPSSTTHYMVAAADIQVPGFAPVGYGLYTTGVNLLSTPNNGAGFSEVTGSADQIAVYQFNVFNDADTGCAGVNGCATSAAGGNDSRFWGAIPSSGNNSYPETLSFTGARKTWGTVGSSLDFFAMTFPAPSSGNPVSLSAQQYAGGSWNLATNGLLTYTVAGNTQVPVPAAIWLLGSGLLGLGTVSRRRRVAQAA